MSTGTSHDSCIAQDSIKAILCIIIIIIIIIIITITITITVVTILLGLANSQDRINSKNKITAINTLAVPVQFVASE